MSPVSTDLMLKSAAGATQGGAASDGAPGQHLVDKFQALMQQAPMAPPLDPEHDGATIVKKMAMEHDAALTSAVNGIEDSLEHPAQTVPGLVQQSVQNSWLMANVKVETDGKMALQEAARGSINSLLKNQ